MALRRAVDEASRAALGFGPIAELLESRLLLAGNVVINELMYHASSQNVGDEWVELYNKGGTAVDLTGWHFGKGINFTFAAGTTLGAGQYLVVAHDLTRFHANYPSVSNVGGGWTGQLGNNGDTVELDDATGAAEDSVSYGTDGEWSVREADRGVQLVTNITRSGSTATVSIPAHGYNNGDTIQISGAAQPEYNGTFTVANVTPGSFTITVSGTPASPATAAGVGGVILSRQLTDLGHAGVSWVSLADGLGKSLELINSNLPNSSGENWAASTTNQGTPGAPNSVAASDSAPLILNTAQSPIVPKSTDAVTITTKLVDELGSAQSGTLFYRLDGAASFTAVTMHDDGTGGDARAGDGVWSAQIPSQANNAIVEYYVSATDGANTRTWPAPLLDGSQSANALYEVDDSPAYIGNQPVFRLIMKAADKQELASIGSPGSASQLSNAAFNGTFVATDGTGTDVRYTVGFRNRGGGSRDALPNNRRIDFHNAAADRWRGLRAINLNGEYSMEDVIGSAVARAAGLAAQDASPVQVRIDNVNEATSGSTYDMFGSYSWVEAENSDFVNAHFPTDSSGNYYRGVDSGHNANLTYLGTDPSLYYYKYPKQNNTEANDYADLINLTKALDPTQTPDSTAGDPNNFVDVISQNLNVAETLRYFAVNELIGNEETSLATGYGDDFSMYRGVTDPRFQLIAHDLDTVLGRGDTASNIDKTLFAATSLATAKRLLTNPAFAPLYFKTLRDLATGLMSPAQLLPLIDQTVGDYVSTDAINTMKAYITGRDNFVLASIPTSLTVTSPLAVSNGYPTITGTTATITTTLSGVADVTQTSKVLVNGVAVTYTAVPSGTPTTGPYGAWSASSVTLNPGLNHVLVQELDASGKEVGRQTIDLYYNRTSGGTTIAAGNVSGTWSPASAPYTVTGTVTVPAGQTLTILPGTTVFFSTGAGILVNGTLNAQGTDAQHIRLTRVPGATTTWKGLDFENTTTNNALAYVDMEYGDAGFYTPAHGSTPNVTVNNSTISIDHMTWAGTTKQLVNCINSSIKMTNSVTPAVAGVEPIHFWIMPASGFAIFQGNTFNPTNGHNDIIDLTSGSHTGPVARFLDNVFLGNGPTGNADDLLDLDSTNAYCEGNVFMNVSASTTADTNSAISGGTDPSFPGVPSEITSVRNYFYNVEHAYLFKEGNFLTSVNNTIVGVLKSVYNFDEPGNGTAGPGRGAYVDGDVIYNLAPGGALFTNYVSGTQLSINHSVLPVAPPAGIPQAGNVITADPRFVGVASLSSSSTGADVRAALQLKPGSPVLGIGPNGRDAGAAVPAGATIAGEPASPTANTSATLTVGGPDIYSYRYRVNGGAWSAEVATTGTQTIAPNVPPIQLTGLTPGTYTVQVEARNYAGVLQSDAGASTSRTWTVTAAPTVLINEVLAQNTSAVNHEGTTPDLIELYNNGPAAVDLGDMSITDDPADPRKFVFAAGTTIPAGGYLVLYADAANATSGIHLGFSLKQSGEGVYLYNAVASGGGLADSVVFGQQLADLSIGRLANGSWALTKPTFGSANVAQPTGDPSTLKINEWLTAGVAPIANDFVELYNPDALPVNLGGLLLTNQPIGDPQMSPIPALSFVAGGGFTSFVADGHPNSGADHVNFTLPHNRGEIALFDAAGNRIDRIEYLDQKTAVSQGRSPNGDNSAKPFTYFAQPSPDISNPSTPTTTQNLINYTDAWKYYQSGALASGWQATGFIDSSWSSGGGLLYVSTANLPEPKTTALTLGQTTYYFRRHFTFTGNPANATLQLNTVLDDGAVVYLNGVEVLRVGMPSGTVTGTTTANRLISPQNATFDGPFNVPTAALVNGDNVIAVEVHQNSTSSSDVVFGLAAQATVTTAPPPPPPLRVTEISYNPAYDAPANSPYTSDDAEFIELKNVGSAPLNLTNYQFTAGILFTFPSMTLAPGADVVVVKNLAAFTQRYGTGVLVAGQYTDSLSNAGEEVRLVDANGNVVQDFTYSDAWQPSTDGGGSTLVINDPTADPSTWGSAASWHASQSILGTPGQDESAVTPPAGSIIINELLSHPQVTGNDWIEFKNTTNAPIDISGWYLSDSSSNLLKYQIPTGTVVPANGYVVLDEATTFGAAFGFNQDGDQAYLSSSGSADALSGYRVGVSFGAADVNVPFATYTASTGEVDFVAESAPTPGAANAYPLVGPVVINELMYDPSGGGDEYVELRNVTNSVVNLYDPANPADTWQFTDGITFAFPQGVSIPANGLVLVVPIDPATFRSKYNIPASVQIFGPYTGALNNAGESVAISRPGTPDNGVVPYITVDHVNYGNAAPWPTSPHGSGPSLERVDPVLYANDSANWQASAAVGGSPGADNLPPGFSASSGAGYAFSAGTGVGQWVLTVQSGTVTLAADLATALPNLAIHIAGGGSLVLTSPIQHLSSLSVDAGGTVDVGVSRLLLDANAMSDADVRALLAAGEIISSFASANAGDAVGYGTAADGVAGLTAGQLLVAPALVGDTTLKGSVGFGDYQNLLSSFGKTSGATWAQGDTNYDGAVGFGDYQSLLSNFGKTANIAAPQPATYAKASDTTPGTSSAAPVSPAVSAATVTATPPSPVQAAVPPSDPAPTANASAASSVPPQPAAKTTPPTTPRPPVTASSAPHSVNTRPAFAQASGVTRSAAKTTPSARRTTATVKRDKPRITVRPVAVAAPVPPAPFARGANEPQDDVLLGRYDHRTSRVWS